MGKVKSVDNCKHPNSRKTLALAKQLKKQSNKEKKKLESALKQNLLLEKTNWFKDRLLGENSSIVTALDLENAIIDYLARFNDELEQIELKSSIGMRKNNARKQHSGRKDAITITITTERNEFLGPGLEIPDFLDAKNLQTIKKWNGELKFLQNIKMKRYSKYSLEKHPTYKANQTENMKS